MNENRIELLQFKREDFKKFMYTLEYVDILNDDTLQCVYEVKYLQQNDGSYLYSGGILEYTLKDDFENINIDDLMNDINKINEELHKIEFEINIYDVSDRMHKLDFKCIDLD